MRALLLLLAIAGCADKATDTGAPTASTASRPLSWPFPNAELMDASGHVSLPDDLPFADGGTPIPTDHVAWRTGFSPVQTTVFDLGPGIDAGAIPGLDDLDAAGSVQIWDLTAGDRLPAWAELDAWPDNEEAPVLLVRPAAPMPVGHRVAVVVTEDLSIGDDATAWYRDAVAGLTPAGLEGRVAHYQDLDAQLDALGVPPRHVAVDFPIGDPTAPTRHVAASVGLPTAWTWTRTVDRDAGEDLPPGIWKRLEATYTTDNWLVDDAAFDLDAAGIPAAQGTAEAKLFVFLPESVRDAEPGTVPVWIFGHGIFANPATYFGADDDPMGTIDLANRAGAIVVATVWRGLTTTDLPTAVSVGNDFGRFPELSDKLVQGVANTIALSRLVREGALLDDPLLEGLGDPETVRYHGISLGGIEGAVMLANHDALEHAVLHVGGSAWSTMLERSSNWTQFEPLVADSIPSPADRQQLYALSQLFWDPADPANYAADLQGKSILWQVALHDEQVPNHTTELLARGVGLTVVEPATHDTFGLSTAALPVAPPALTWFDPEAPAPPAGNRPAPTTRAHSDPRLWDGSKLQAIRFLDPDDPGVIEHFCGDAVCSASNPGG